jgi:hypothetical protein
LIVDKHPDFVLFDIKSALDNVLGGLADLVEQREVLRG